MMRSIGIMFLLLLTALPAISQSREVPYTLDDRDRVIRVEARMEALEAKMDAVETKMDIKFDSQQQQLNDLKTMFFWGFGIIITLIIFILGYMIWDRRTALKPALDKADEAGLFSKSIMRVLRDYAQKNTEFAEIMKIHGLL